MNIRNIAIIAHVDHGKTTLVDAMLKQTHTFRDNQKEMDQELIMDKGELEREKGITILAKNTAVMYQGTKINIIDTPGHADFGGEVERVINMASGALLLVDAAEGPLPQTKFVLKKALEVQLKIIVLINKIDRKEASPMEVVVDVENLFLELANDDAALDFITLFGVGRDGKAFFELPINYSQQTPGDLTPLFDTIVKEIPEGTSDTTAPFQMLISTLDYDNYVGKLCIGKVTKGTLAKDEHVTVVDENKVMGTYKVQKLYTSMGLERVEVPHVTAGDIVAVAGIPDLTIGQTITSPLHPVSLPMITVEEPTIKVTIGPSSSPLSGRDGSLYSSAQIKKRLMKEKESNVGLRIEIDSASSNYVVCGRGELHLAILIETMRREGYEMEVSKPQVIYKTIGGVLSEPFEEVTIDIDSIFVGIITEEMGRRKGQMINMTNERNNVVRFVYRISSQNLLGLRTILLTKTKGTVLLNTYFLGYMPKSAKTESHRNGVLIASESGPALSYGLANAQERGMLFVGPGEEVYAGMVVGVSTRNKDIEVNVCKGKKLTNVRSATSDVAVQLTPASPLSLEQALDFIAEDELLEATPKNLRIRKRTLDFIRRRVQKRKEEDMNREL